MNDLGIFSPESVHMRLSLAHAEGLRRAKVRQDLDNLHLNISKAHCRVIQARGVLAYQTRDGAFVPRIARQLLELLEAEAELYALETYRDHVEPDVIAEGRLDV